MSKETSAVQVDQQAPVARWHSERVEAERLGMAITTLQNWRKAGKGPPYEKFEGTVRYNPVDVDAWIRAEGAKARAAA